MGKISFLGGEIVGFRKWAGYLAILRRKRAMKRVRAFRKQLPAGWKFDRDEANAR